MQRRHWLHRCTRWLTLLAMVATLAPGVAHALRHARGEVMPWSQLCSATGGKRVLFGARADGGSPLQPAHAFEQCAQCALHHDGQVPQGSAWSAALRADLTQAVAPLVLHAPQVLPLWRRAQPRAPPLPT